MAIRTMLLGVACIASAMWSAVPAQAGTQCVTYWVSGPVVGQVGDTKCSPDVSQMTHYFELGYCDSENPPLQQCVVLKLHTL
jgi:hypothetical protein